MARRRRRRTTRPPSSDPHRFEQAIAWHRKRVPVSEVEWQGMNTGQRQRAFKVAGVAQAGIVQQVFNAIDRAIELGTGLADFRGDVKQKLERSWGRSDSPRIETIFRTNLQSAYNAGRDAIFRDPVVQEARPYLRYDAVDDARTSEICEAMDGVVLPANHPLWRERTPPLHHRCRSILTPLTREEAEDEGIASGPPATSARVADGFGSAPDSEGIDWQPDIGDFSPELRQALMEKLR